ncbi:MAG: thiolase family protein [Flavobacteriales bacterium]|jgi:acetyl-CoA acyltransferase|nr:thiolase family protein [Flavobacteriales bacterium]MBT7423938.1 thiolase family protein [Candidatus Neomarinimicrobiota bacterium]
MFKSVIAGYSRSPFTIAKKGELINVKPDELLSEVIKNLISKSKINKTDIEDVIIGCAFPEGEQGFNIGKIVTFLSDMNVKTAGTTINRWCGSSMEAIHIAAGKISMGAGKAFICGGVESMSRVTSGFNPLPYPKSSTENPHLYFTMGNTAENVAKKYNIDRRAQQEFAISSHQKADEAQSNGKFDKEITIINNCSKDGGIRPNSNHEILDGLKVIFDKNGTVTAATSSPLTDGAATTLVCEEQYAKDNNLKILGRIVSTAVEGCDPNYMGLGPIGASQKALKRADLSINDIDIVELNEAFASQSLACIKDLEIDLKKVNLDGGAISLGHPLGATGARITGKAADLLIRENKKYALATQCIGYGMGIATIIENIN